MYNVLDMENYSVNREIKKETLLEVSRLAAQKTNWKSILDQVIQFVRPYFIFDNIVIYLPEIETKRLEVLYARATGRGKSAGADVTWGETIANRVVDGKETIIERPEFPIGPDRLEYPFILGLPLFLTDTFIGALIFIRFGGPEYLSEGIEFAEFLQTQISYVLKGKSLADFEQELESQRNSTKLQEDFINTISHELRSPLGFIRGYTTTLLRKDAEWDVKTQNDFLEIIEREANNLTDLIDNLLDSSRLQSGQMRFEFQTVRLNSLIRDEVNRAAINHPDQSVILEFADELPAIRGDARRLAQVFDNLLSNSHKYAPGSSIKYFSLSFEF